jgi:nucleoside-diphosphate-sugar epimerase
MRVLVAGATGAVGRRLVPRLIAAGHQVTGTTRREDKADGLRALGAKPVVVDALDGVAVGEAVARAEPEVVIHELTALSGASNLRKFDQTFAVTNELRTRGLDNLLTAAKAAGAGRFLAQSYTGWTNIREGGPVKTEDDPLDPHPPAAQALTMAAIRYLERAVADAAPMQGVVLRYGLLYGPGASDEMVAQVRARKFPLLGRGTGVWSFLHADDAAEATVVAVTRGEGVYNIVDDEPAPAAQWLPYLADVLGARPPYRLPVWLGRLAAGEVGASLLTQIRGSSNAKARRELGWQPVWPSWREGFRAGLTDAAAG